MSVERAREQLELAEGRWQNAIHEHYPFSKYDVERLRGTFTPEMAEIPHGF